VLAPSRARRIPGDAASGRARHYPRPIGRNRGLRSDRAPSRGRGPNQSLSAGHRAAAVGRAVLISDTARPGPSYPPASATSAACCHSRHLVTALQNPWFGFGWSGTDLAVLAAYAVVAGVPARWLFSRGLSDISGATGTLLHGAGDSPPHETGGVIGGQNSHRPRAAFSLNRQGD